MKFVALALTILLAAGCQARFLQADAPAPPSQLEHVRSAVGLYLSQVKETLLKALEHLDDTEFKDHKQKITEGLNNMQTYIQTGSETLSPYTDAISMQFMEATKDMREKIQADVEQLKKDLAPMRAELKEVVDKHIEEYRAQLQPVYDEYQAKHKQEMEELKKKMEPVVEELRAKIQVNVEETKSKLVPIVEAIRSKLTERLEELRKLAEPYVQDYKDHLKEALTEVKDKVSPQVDDLHGKIQPFTEELKTKLMALWEALSKTKSS